VDLVNWVLTLYAWYVTLMVALGFLLALGLWMAAQARRWRKRVPGSAPPHYQQRL
jgi:hypothetical protein